MARLKTTYISGSLILTGQAGLAFEPVMTGASMTATSAHSVILISGNSSVTLPDAAVEGKYHVYQIKNTGTGTITATPSASQTIDGQSALTFGQYTCVTMISNGTNWYVL